MINPYEFPAGSRTERVLICRVLKVLAGACTVFALMVVIFTIMPCRNDWQDYRIPEEDSDDCREGIMKLGRYVVGVIQRHGLGWLWRYMATAIALHLFLGAAADSLKRTRYSRVDAPGTALIGAAIVWMIYYQRAHPDLTVNIMLLAPLVVMAMAAAGVLVQLVVRFVSRGEAKRLAEKGRRAIQPGGAAQAIELIESSLALIPGNSDTLITLADALRVAKRDEEALLALRTALQFMRPTQRLDPVVRAKANAVKQTMLEIESPPTAPHPGIEARAVERQAQFSATSPLDNVYHTVARHYNADFFPGRSHSQGYIPAAVVGNHRGFAFVVSGVVRTQRGPFAQTTLRVAVPLKASGELVVKRKLLKGFLSGSGQDLSVASSFDRFFKVKNSAWTGRDVTVVPEFQKSMLAVHTALSGGWGFPPNPLMPLIRTFRMIIDPNGILIMSNCAIDNVEHLETVIEAALRTCDLLSPEGKNDGSPDV